MTNPSSSPNWVGILLVVAFVGWRFYRRFRRLIGRQRLGKARPWFTVFFYLGLTLLLLGSLHTHPANAACLTGGFMAGAALGFYGLKKTLFERTPEGLFYTPHAHLGIALSAVFLLRMTYRMLVINTSDSDRHDFGRSPVTLAIFGLLAGYYVLYAIGLLRWQFSATPVKAPEIQT